MTFKGESDSGAGKVYLGIMIFLVPGQSAAVVAVWISFVKGASQGSGMVYLETDNGNFPLQLVGIWCTRDSQIEYLGPETCFLLGKWVLCKFRSISRHGVPLSSLFHFLGIQETLFPTVSPLLEFYPFPLGQYSTCTEKNFLALYSSNPFIDYWTTFFKSSPGEIAFCSDNVGLHQFTPKEMSF